MRKEHPKVRQDLFEVIPCSFVGMPGGCMFHGHRYQGQHWLTPELVFSPYRRAARRRPRLESSTSSDGDEGDRQPPPGEEVEPAGRMDFFGQLQHADGETTLANLQSEIRTVVARFLRGVETDDEE